MSIEKPPANKPKVHRTLMSIEKPPANNPKVHRTLMSIEKPPANKPKVRRTLMSVYIETRRSLLHPLRSGDLNLQTEVKTINRRPLGHSAQLRT